MNDIYIDKNIQEIEKNINEKNFLIIGKRFRDLMHYGITLNNSNLVFLSSEIMDIFRNSLSRIEEFRKELDLTELEKMVISIKELLKFFKKKEEELDVQDKCMIYNLLAHIIYNSEKIQAHMDEIEAYSDRKRLYSYMKRKNP